MTAAEWLEESERAGWFDGGRSVIEGMARDLGQLEYQVAAYREDRLALIDRIHELEADVNALQDQVG